MLRRLVGRDGLPSFYVRHKQKTKKKKKQQKSFFCASLSKSDRKLLINACIFIISFFIFLEKTGRGFLLQAVTHRGDLV